jgi:BASS family bile acid:Na+ symporter
MGEGIVSIYILPIVLAIIMFNLGLSLRMDDFRSIFKYPKQLFIGLFCQIILLPLIAFTIANICGLSNEIKIGIMIIAACPGGAVSNLITYYLKGSVPLSVALTTANSILILVTLPLIVFFSMNHFMDTNSIIEMSTKATIIKIFIMILIPTGLGMLLRYRHILTAKKLERILKHLSIFLLAAVYTVVIFEKKGGRITTFQEYLTVAPWVFLLNIIGMFTGYMMGRLNHLNTSKQMTLAIEVGIQNSALAITIASSPAFLGNHEMALPAVVYGIFTFFSAIIFGMMIKKWAKK